MTIESSCALLLSRGFFFASRASVKKGDVARRGSSAGACSALVLRRPCIKKGDVARRGSSAGDGCSVLVLAGLSLKKGDVARRGRSRGASSVLVLTGFPCWQGFH